MKNFISKLLHRSIVKLAEMFHMRLPYELFYDAYQADLMEVFVESGKYLESSFADFCLAAYKEVYLKEFSK